MKQTALRRWFGPVLDVLPTTKKSLPGPRTFRIDPEPVLACFGSRSTLPNPGCCPRKYLFVQNVLKATPRVFFNRVRRSLRTAPSVLLFLEEGGCGATDAFVQVVERFRSKVLQGKGITLLSRAYQARSITSGKRETSRFDREYDKSLWYTRHHIGEERSIDEK